MATPQLKPQRVDNSLIPAVIFVLLVANGLMFAAQNLLGDLNYARGPITTLWYLRLWTFESELFIPTAVLTYGFLHADASHLLINMFQLWMFGRDIERVWGPRRFALYYIVCVVGAGIVQLIVAAVQGGAYSTLGASGGVFGILMAFGLLFPNRQVMLLFPPIPMKAKYLVVLFGLFELFYGVSGYMPGVANFAHLGGMVFGFALIAYWRGGRIF